MDPGGRRGCYARISVYCTGLHRRAHAHSAQVARLIRGGNEAEESASAAGFGLRVVEKGVFRQIAAALSIAIRIGDLREIRWFTEIYWEMLRDNFKEDVRV